MRADWALWTVVGCFVVAAIGVILIKTWPQLHPEVAWVAPVDSTCNLRAGPCETQTPEGGRVHFSVQPRSIPVVQPLQLSVQVDRLVVETVSVDFSGVDMEMGFNRPRLSAQGAGLFSGEGMLPVCVRDAMEWEAKVLLGTPDGLLAIPYRFVTVQPGQAPPE